MKKVLLEDIQLGNTGSVSKDKINTNFGKLNEALSVLDNDIAQKPNKEDVVIGMIHKGSVAKETDLPTADEAIKGHAYYVKDKGYIYQCDGTKWNATAFTVFPSNTIGYDEVFDSEGNVKDELLKGNLVQVKEYADMASLSADLDISSNWYSSAYNRKPSLYRLSIKGPAPLNNATLIITQNGPSLTQILIGPVQLNSDGTFSEGTSLGFSSVLTRQYLNSMFYAWKTVLRTNVELLDKNDKIHPSVLDGKLIPVLEYKSIPELSADLDDYSKWRSSLNNYKPSVYKIHSTGNLNNATLIISQNGSALTQLLISPLQLQEDGTFSEGTALSHSTVLTRQMDTSYKGSWKTVLRTNVELLDKNNKIHPDTLDGKLVFNKSYSDANQFIADLNKYSVWTAKENNVYRISINSKNCKIGNATLFISEANGAITQVLLSGLPSSNGAISTSTYSLSNTLLSRTISGDTTNTGWVEVFNTGLPVQEELNKKADKTYVDTELKKKADKTYTDTELGKKADKTYVDTELKKKADKTYTDTEVGKKADKSYVDAELSKKANSDYVNSFIEVVDDGVNPPAKMIKDSVLQGRLTKYLDLANVDELNELLDKLVVANEDYDITVGYGVSEGYVNVKLLTTVNFSFASPHLSSFTQLLIGQFSTNGATITNVGNEKSQKIYYRTKQGNEWGNWIQFVDKIYIDNKVQLIKDMLYVSGGPISIYAGTLKNMGADEVAVSNIKSQYEALSTSLKKMPDVLLLPSFHMGENVLGMKAKTGEITSFTYSRNSAATYFDKNGMLQLVTPNVPREDYKNYSGKAKLLIEDESTNMAFNSMTFDGWGRSFINMEKSGIRALGYDYFYKFTKIDNVGSRGVSSNKLGVVEENGVYSARMLFKKGNTDKVSFGLHFTTSSQRWGLLKDTECIILSGNATISEITASGLFVIENIEDEVLVEIRRKANADNQNEIGSSILLIFYPNSHSRDGMNTYMYAAYPQAEVKKHATSYIPTYGSQATRVEDHLSYYLDTPCSVYIETSKRKVMLDKPKGNWEIDKELYNEGIYCIAIFDRVLTPDEKLDNFDYDVINSFIMNVKADGGTIDEALWKEGYSNLTEAQKQSYMNVLPGAYKGGKIYGIVKDGSLIPFNFDRKSAAAYLDKNNNLAWANVHIPRIDYFNYGGSPKLLIENASANKVLHSVKLDEPVWGKNNVLVGKSTLKAFNGEPYYIVSKTTTEQNSSIRQVIKLDSEITDGAVTVKVAIRKGNQPSVGISLYNGAIGYGDIKDYSCKILKGDASPRITSSGLMIDWQNEEEVYLEYTRKNVDFSFGMITLTLYPYRQASQVGDYAYFTSVQLEERGQSTSYIPTADSPMARMEEEFSVEIEKACSVYIQTSRRKVIIDRAVGKWEIHKGIENEGIHSITMYDRVLTPEEKEGIDYDVTESFIMDVKTAGGRVDEALLKESYNRLSPFQKQSYINILPGAYQAGKVYGMVKDGSLVELDFRRESSATYFDENTNLRLVDKHVPRFDYLNHSEHASLLLEKASANLLRYSGGLNEPSWINNAVSAEDSGLKAFGYDNYYKVSKTSQLTNSNLFQTIKVDINRSDTVTARVAIKRGNQSSVGLSFHGSAMGYGQASDYSYRILKGDASVRLSSTGTGLYADWKNDDEVLIEYTRSNISASGNMNLNLYPYRADSPAGDYAYFTSVQLEEGNISTSYIPTTTTQLTRTQENLSFRIEKPCSVYIETTKRKVILDKTVGEWQIHTALDNEGIYSITIFDHVLTPEEKKSLDYDIIESFITGVKADGGTVDETLWKEGYNNLTEVQKQSDVILLPGAYKNDRLYGFCKDGALTPLYFHRESQATCFDKDGRLKLMDMNPRVDYFNYGSGAKVLVEKASTNLIPDSLDLLSGKWNIGNTYIKVEKSDIRALGYDYFWKITKLDNGSNRNVGRIIPGIKLSEGMMLTQRCLFKKGTTDKVSFGIYLTGAGNNWGSISNVTCKILSGNATVGNQSGSLFKITDIEDEVCVEVTREIVASDLAATAVNMLAYPDSSVSNTANVHLYMAYPQFEINSCSTSYIPTITEQATRTEESLSMDMTGDAKVELSTTKGIRTLDSKRGTLYLEKETENEGIYYLTINYK